MNLKRTFIQQHQSVVNRAASAATALQVPREGWLRTTRKALGMSGAQLGRRLGVTRGRIAHAERAELDGGITLKTLQAAAEAMGCQLVYAIVPAGTVEDLVWAQARSKAERLVGNASLHMSLEDQALPAGKITQQIDNLSRSLVHEMPADFWDDK